MPAGASPDPRLARAQAWIADRLGDPTPRNDGRVTLNPPPHVDLLGTVILPLICVFYLQPRLAQINFFLAWTKPVPTKKQLEETTSKRPMPMKSNKGLPMAMVKA